MNGEQVIRIFDAEAIDLERTLRRHPQLSPIFTQQFVNTDIASLKAGYLTWLRMTRDYVIHSAPMLAAAGHALRDGDAEDRAWSEIFLHYSEDEIDPEEKYGHQIWAENDMKALGVSDAELAKPALDAVRMYGRYHVEQAAQHPYSILGAKGVLEHLSVRMADDMARGVIAAGIAQGEVGTSFCSHHGVLDIDHVKGGDENVLKIRSPAKLQQMIEGAFFTAGCYRLFLRDYLEG